MLILERDVEEVVVVRVAGRVVRIKVTEVKWRKGGSAKVRLGFDAPLDVEIVREEVDRRTRT